MPTPPNERPRVPSSPWTKRRATYPDAETARLFGDVYEPHVVTNPRTRPRVENRQWLKAQAEGAALLAFVRADPDFNAQLESCLQKLATRKQHSVHSGRPVKAARDNFDVGNRRQYFHVLATYALRAYLAETAIITGLFLTKPNYAIPAFKRLCVIEHFTRLGKPEFPRP